MVEDNKGKNFCQNIISKFGPKTEKQNVPTMGFRWGLEGRGGGGGENLRQIMQDLP